MVDYYKQGPGVEFGSDYINYDVWKSLQYDVFIGLDVVEEQRKVKAIDARSLIKTFSTRGPYDPSWYRLRGFPKKIRVSGRARKRHDAGYYIEALYDGLLRRVNGTIIATNKEIAFPGMKTLKERAQAINIWAINTPEEWEILMEYGLAEMMFEGYAEALVPMDRAINNAWGNLSDAADSVINPIIERWVEYTDGGFEYDYLIESSYGPEMKGVGEKRWDPGILKNTPIQLFADVAQQAPKAFLREGVITTFIRETVQGATETMFRQIFDFGRIPDKRDLSLFLPPRRRSDVFIGPKSIPFMLPIQLGFGGFV